MKTPEKIYLNREGLITFSTGIPISNSTEYIRADILFDFVNWIPERFQYRSSLGKVGAKILWIEYLAHLKQKEKKAIK